VGNEPFAIDGFTFSAVSAGIKHANTDRLDLCLIAAESPCPAAGVFTTNLVKAAPVQLCAKRLEQGFCQAIVANSGNANAFTGEQGMADAAALTAEVAERLNAPRELVIAMSTGVIGNPLPMDRMRSRIPDLVSGLDPSKGMDVAKAILTTDTRPKTVFFEAETSRGPCRMVGLAKGSGMIAPNMATMLAVVLTDMRVDPAFLRDCLKIATDASFNRITVDGDTSTNDSLVAMAGGRADARELSDSRADRESFAHLMHRACGNLARQIVADGEGATKLVEIRVCGAPDDDAATRVARTIADSPLVKTAFYGEDPNWGRIVCAAGRAGVLFDPDAIDLFIGEVQVLRQGKLASDQWEPAAAAVMKANEFTVKLDLKAGQADARVLTTDLSKEYVVINADYRS
jgi:glutamate N-acetyltransferase / amino-acid N-acetyltransferase